MANTKVLVDKHGCHIKGDVVELIVVESRYGFLTATQVAVGDYHFKITQDGSDEMIGIIDSQKLIYTPSRTDVGMNYDMLYDLWDLLNELEIEAYDI